MEPTIHPATDKPRDVSPGSDHHRSIDSTESTSSRTDIRSSRSCGGSTWTLVLFGLLTLTSQILSSFYLHRITAAFKSTASGGLPLASWFSLQLGLTVASLGCLFLALFCLPRGAFFGTLGDCWAPLLLRWTLRLSLVMCFLTLVVQVASVMVSTVLSLVLLVLQLACDSTLDVLEIVERLLRETRELNDIILWDLPPIDSTVDWCARIQDLRGEILIALGCGCLTHLGLIVVFALGVAASRVEFRVHT